MGGAGSVATKRSMTSPPSSNVGGRTTRTGVPAAWERWVVQSRSQVARAGGQRVGRSPKRPHHHPPFFQPASDALLLLLLLPLLLRNA